MAGAGFKTFVDGDILTAAQVNTYLMEQSVMVFASAAARTSAIAAPSEGMVTYLSDNDLIEYYDGAAWQPILDQDVIAANGDLIVGTGDDTVSRLAVGTNNHVLTADSSTATGLKWANAAAATGFVKITASTFTGQSAVTFDNVFTSTYRNYKLFFTGRGTSSVGIRYVWRASGSDITASNYQNQYVDFQNTTTTPSRFNGAYGELPVVHNGFRSAADVTIFEPQVATFTQVIGTTIDTTSSTETNFRLRGGFYNASTQMDGIKLYPSSGTIDGTIIIYGMEA